MRKEGKRINQKDMGVFKRAFDDCTDPENVGLIPMQMKMLSKDERTYSERSHSSGSGNYENYDRNDLVNDPDLQLLKTLTKEKAAKD